MIGWHPLGIGVTRIITRATILGLLAVTASCTHTPKNRASSLVRHVMELLNRANESTFSEVLPKIDALAATLRQDAEVDVVREFISSLREKTRKEITDSDLNNPTSVAKTFFSVLRRFGIRYDSQVNKEAMSSGREKISQQHTLYFMVTEKKGICTSLSIAGALVLQGFNVRCRLVVWPGHCYLQVLKGKNWVNVESTAGGKTLPTAFYRRDYQRDPTVKPEILEGRKILFYWATFIVKRLYAEGRWNEAIDLGLKLTAKGTRNMDLYRVLGQSWYRKGYDLNREIVLDRRAMSEAKNWMRKCLDLYKVNKNAIDGMIALCSNLKEEEELFIWLRRYRMNFPLSDRTWRGHFWYIVVATRPPRLLSEFKNPEDAEAALQVIKRWEKVFADDDEVKRVKAALEYMIRD